MVTCKKRLQANSDGQSKSMEKLGAILLEIAKSDWGDQAPGESPPGEDQTGEGL